MIFKLDYCDEISQLAQEIEETEECQTGVAYIRASRMVDDLLAFARQWDEQTQDEQQNNRGTSYVRNGIRKVGDSRF